MMHTCENCKYKNPYGDVTMQDDHCGGCCSWNDKWEPTPEPEEVTEE